ncbi:hypothetical protein ABVK25_012517 [Lepraria finkii]|uniref:Uncharacterized protein n=1 Tax=Lepraria finkii TaxID=1340010 RepID=A0ABR4AFW1_9LECA
MSESPFPQNATQAAPDPNLTGSDQLSKVNSHLPLRMNQPSGPKEHVHLPKNVLDKLNNPGASRVHSSSEANVGKDTKTRSAAAGEAFAGAQPTGDQNAHSSTGNGGKISGREQRGGAQEPTESIGSRGKE